jgi:hypothetical protein
MLLNDWLVLIRKLLLVAAPSRHGAKMTFSGYGENKLT